MEIDEHIAALQREGDLLADVVARTALDAPVPTCPDWTLRDLARHTGGVHRWAANYVGGRREYVEETLDEIVGIWPDDADLVGWFREGHAALVAAFESAPEDLECFTFLPALSPRAMWARRQAHETAIHRADAKSAEGGLPSYPPDFAADGIDELLTGFLARPRRGPRVERPFSIRVEADDVDVVWSMEIAPGAYSVVGEERDADVVVRGPASDLYLLVWNRRDPDGLEVTGDAGLLQDWQSSVRVRWS